MSSSSSLLRDRCGVSPHQGDFVTDCDARRATSPAIQPTTSGYASCAVSCSEAQSSYKVKNKLFTSSGQEAQSQTGCNAAHSPLGTACGHRATQWSSEWICCSSFRPCRRWQVAPEGVPIWRTFGRWSIPPGGSPWRKKPVQGLCRTLMVKHGGMGLPARCLPWSWAWPWAAVKLDPGCPAELVVFTSHKRLSWPCTTNEEWTVRKQTAVSKETMHFNIKSINL